MIEEDPSYRIKPAAIIEKGFTVTSEKVAAAVKLTNGILSELPRNLFTTIDLKTTSSLVGAVFCQSLASEIEGAIVNPIEKGHPDIIPISGAEATEEQLRNYPDGLEIKCTVGNVKKDSKLKAGTSRLECLTAITWQAHHQEVRSLMGLIWDFATTKDDFSYPAVTAVFFTDNLGEEDWGAISGTTGRNTKVCGMTASGRAKMGAGWIAVREDYLKKYSLLLKIPA